MGRYMRWIYAGWFGTIAVAIVLQFYLAGYAVFGFHGLNDFGPHLVVGDLIGIAILWVSVWRLPPACRGA